MKLIKTALLTLVLSITGLTVAAPATTFALVDPLGGVCSDASADNPVCKAKSDNGGALIGKIINTLLFVVGALSVVMIIVGGIFYATSAGDAGRVARGKNTVMYAVVGLVVSFLAYAIVNWVFNLFK